MERKKSLADTQDQPDNKQTIVAGTLFFLTEPKFTFLEWRCTIHVAKDVKFRNTNFSKLRYFTHLGLFTFGAL